MHAPICPYCSEEGALVKGIEIYPHRPDLATMKFWLCKPCFAYVGVHNNSKNSAPYGTMARPNLRKLRAKAHALFDPIWKNGHYNRIGAYGLLARAMGIKTKDCHIGYFNEEQCALVIQLCKEMKDN